VRFVGYTRPAHELPKPHTDTTQRPGCLFAVDDDIDFRRPLIEGNTWKLARQANALFDAADVGITDKRINLLAALRTRSVFRHFALLGQFYRVVL
jgi:hypothetical protein